MTPVSTADPYCTASRLFAYHDWRQVADLVSDPEREQAPRPGKASLLDSTTPYGSLVLATLMSASGTVESACLVGNRYQPSDLQVLTGASQAFLQKLVADLAFWDLVQRRQPMGANPQRVPGAMQAIETVEKLKGGERIFGLAEAADAGLPSVSEPAPANDPIGQRLTVREASRLFGIRGRDRNCYGG